MGAAAVQTLGVLRLGLAVVAGQTLGALAIDLIAPAAGEKVTVADCRGVLLTLAAVWVSGRAGLRRLRLRPWPGRRRALSPAGATPA